MVGPNKWWEVGRLVPTIIGRLGFEVGGVNILYQQHYRLYK